MDDYEYLFSEAESISSRKVSKTEHQEESRPIEGEILRVATNIVPPGVQREETFLDIRVGKFGQPTIQRKITTTKKLYGNEKKTFNTRTSEKSKIAKFKSGIDVLVRLAIPRKTKGSVGMIDGNLHISTPGTGVETVNPEKATVIREKEGETEVDHNTPLWYPATIFRRQGKNYVVIRKDNRKRYTVKEEDIRLAEKQTIHINSVTSELRRYLVDNFSALLSLYKRDSEALQFKNIRIDWDSFYQKKFDEWYKEKTYDAISNDENYLSKLLEQAEREYEKLDIAEALLNNFIQRYGSITSSPSDMMKKMESLLNANKEPNMVIKKYQKQMDTKIIWMLRIATEQDDAAQITILTLADMRAKFFKDSVRIKAELEDWIIDEKVFEIMTRDKPAWQINNEKKEFDDLHGNELRQIYEKEHKEPTIVQSSLDSSAKAQAQRHEKYINDMYGDSPDQYLAEFLMPYLFLSEFSIFTKHAKFFQTKLEKNRVDISKLSIPDYIPELFIGMNPKDITQSKQLDEIFGYMGVLLRFFINYTTRSFLTIKDPTLRIKSDITVPKPNFSENVFANVNSLCKDHNIADVKICLRDNKFICELITE